MDVTEAPRTRIALVGAGRMGQVHLAALQSSDEITVVAVVEPFAVTRERLQAEGLVVYETVRQLLDAESLDGALIAAPTDQHPELVATFAAAGIPMLCEKPVGVRPADAERATRAAADAGVLLQVGYWRRFVPELRQLREQIAAGELGQICLLSCMQWDSELPSEEFRSHSGGIMVDMGVHEFDQVRWLLGDEFDSIVAVPAGPSTQPRPATDPDSAVLLARTSGGAGVTISLDGTFRTATRAGLRCGEPAATRASPSCGTRRAMACSTFRCAARRRRSRGPSAGVSVRARRRPTRSPRSWSPRGRLKPLRADEVGAVDPLIANLGGSGTTAPRGRT